MKFKSKFFIVFIILSFVFLLVGCSGKDDKPVDASAGDRRKILEYVLSEYRKDVATEGNGKYFTKVASEYSSASYATMEVGWPDLPFDYKKEDKDLENILNSKSTGLSFKFTGPYTEYDGVSIPDKNDSYYIKGYMYYGATEIKDYTGSTIKVSGIKFDVTYSLSFVDHKVENITVTLTTNSASADDAVKERAEALFKNALIESYQFADEWIYKGTNLHWF